MSHTLIHFIMTVPTKTPGWLAKELATAATLILVFVMAFAKIDDTDVWWHMKCGELFIRNGWIPDREIFSYTAQGAPWVDGYLLAQAVFYGAWLAARTAGVILLGALLVTGAYALSLLMCGRRAGYYAAIAVALPAAYLSINCNFPRPALLTPLFSLVTIYMLEDYHKRGGRRVWWLVPLMAVWVNCHPAFFIGPGITAIYLLGAALHGWGNKEGAHAGPPLRNYALLLVSELLATLINPYGPRIYYSVILFASNPRFKEVIVEWAPIYYRWPHLIIWVMPAFCVVAAVGVGCLLWGWRSVRFERASLFTLAALIAITSRRNLMLFALIALPVISWTVSDALAARAASPSPARRGRVSSGGILCGAVCVCALFMTWFAATDRLYYYVHVIRNTGIGVQDVIFSEKAAALLRSEHVQGNLFHQFGLGGFFLFALYPQYRVYIDGRTYPYPFEVFDEGGKALRSPRTFEKLKAQYDIRAVFLSALPGNLPLMEYLLKSKAWAAIYADNAGALFLERGAGNDGTIQRHFIDLLANPPIVPTYPPGRKYRLWSMAEFPYGVLQWGNTYEKIGRPDLALRVLKEGLNYRPITDDLESNVAALMIKTGELEDGYSLLQRILAGKPDDRNALRALADYYSAKGEWGQAENVLNRLVKLDPRSANLWHYLGVTAFNRKDYSLAAERFRRAVEIAPDDAFLWERLGMSMESLNAAEAVRDYRTAIKLLQTSGAPPGDIQRVQARLNKLGG